LNDFDKTDDGFSCYDDIRLCNGKKKVLDIKVTKAISWIIVNIANPALIISGSIGNAIEKMELLSVLKVSIVIYITLIVLD